jgi:integrase/recombinase XerC
MVTFSIWPVLDRHLAWMALRGLSETYRYHRSATIRMIRSQLGIDPLTSNARDLAKWQLTRKVTAATMRTQVTHLIEYARWGVTEQLCGPDLISRLVVPKTARRLPRPCGEDDLSRALSSAPHDVRLMMVLAAWEGLRCSEVAKIDADDVMIHGKPPALLVHGKGSRDRILPLSDAVVAEIRWYGLPKRGPLFPRRDGLPGHNRPQRISQLIGDHLRSEGWTFTAHQMRHRALTQLYQDTHDLRLCQEIAGHARPTTTAGYAAYAHQDAAAALQRLGGTLR